MLSANGTIAKIRLSVLADVSNLHPRCIRLSQYAENAHGKNKEKNKVLLEKKWLDLPVKTAREASTTAGNLKYFTIFV